MCVVKTFTHSAAKLSVTVTTLHYSPFDGVFCVEMIDKQLEKLRHDLTTPSDCTKFISFPT